MAGNLLLNISDVQPPTFGFMGGSAQRWLHIIAINLKREYTQLKKALILAYGFIRLKLCCIAIQRM